VADENSPKIAIIGAGPAGLTAAHYLSLNGYKATVFEAEKKPGGMMFTAIPSYRLPREIIEKEIESLIDENIELKCNTALGKDINIDTKRSSWPSARTRANRFRSRAKTPMVFIRRYSSSATSTSLAKNTPKVWLG